MGGQEHICVCWGLVAVLKKKKPSPQHFISRHKDQINKFKVFKVLADGWMKTGRDKGQGDSAGNTRLCICIRMRK